MLNGLTSFGETSCFIDNRQQCGLQNAGFSGPVVVEAVKNGENDYGFDAEKDRYGSMYEYGIIDPVKVTRSALENAASISAMVLTTESLITELDPPKLPAPFDD